ncbi:MAG: penicillin-binding transpeptidase domain-containing protein [Actinomycetes bacterium]
MGRPGRKAVLGRKSVLAGIATVVAVVAVVAVVVVVRQVQESRRDEAAGRVAAAVAAGLRSGDLTKAAWDADGAAVQKEYASITAGLGGARPSVTVGSVSTSADGGRTARLNVRWPFGPDGWSYSRNLAVSAHSGVWRAHWSPDLVAPGLQHGDTLQASRVAAKRGRILGADGAVLVDEQPVVVVGVQPSRATDVPGLATRLGQLLGVDPAALAKRVAQAKPDGFVEVVTLRQADYDAVKDQLQALPGAVFRQSTLPLAPTREFGRALLGTVGPVTAEIVKESKGRLQAGDVAGLSGLQRRYDERLAGTAGLTVTRVRDGQQTQLFSVPPVDGEPLTLTIDPRIQQAADSALAGATGGNGNAALVAVDVASGAVLAVANTPASGTNRAMTGRYPPGSTFKTVSTQALLATGLTPAEVVPCPPTATVEGRSFQNFEGGAIGAVPFSTDFAQSCNTAFVGLSSRLKDDALKRAAAGVGLGVAWKVGADAFTGDVPVNESAVDRAAATIGQGRVLASPLGMAVAVGTIGRGSWAQPKLVTDPAVDSGEAAPSPVADLAVVRELMRGVVTGGTASALADVPGEPVYAKTGTAEYGSGNPQPTHAWTIGFQGNVAFAVLVEGGASGGSVAVPVAEAFLRALG